MEQLNQILSWSGGPAFSASQTPQPCVEVAKDIRITV